MEEYRRQGQFSPNSKSDRLLALMKSILETGETLKISGFGSFVVKQKEDRRGRNPQTGETLTIEARRILTFKPSTVLKEAINKSCYE